MSDEYLNFSTCFEIKESEEQAAIDSIQKTLESWKNDPENKDQEPRLSAYVIDNTVWITTEHDEHGDTELAALILECLVEDLQIDEPIPLGYSMTCNKHRPGTFGGGAFIVQRGKPTKWINTHQWIDENI